MKNIFTEHPNSIGQSYFKHMGNALRYSFLLILSGIACLIHALLPFLFVTVASNRVFKLAEEFTEVRKRAEQTAANDPQ